VNRFSKVKINLLWQFIYQVTFLILGLVLPRFVIGAYGSEVNGLTSTIKQVILVVSLANAGISTAVTYSLYKPVAENDKALIASTIKNANLIYRRMSFVTLTLGTVASVILAFFQKGSLPALHVFIACFLTCFQTALGFYYTAVHNIFFTATQDKYIISIALLLSGVIMYGGEILLAVLGFHYIWLYVCSVAGCLAQILFLQFIFRKRYKPYALSKDEIKALNYTPIKLSGIKYATVNEVAHCIVTASQTIVITFLCGLSEASVLSVYMMVVNSLSLISQIVYSSFAPSFGSVVAEGNHAKINQVFEIFQFSIIMMTTYMYMIAICMFMPFVSLYTSGVNDIDYLSKVLMYLAVIYGIFYAIRVPYNIVASSFGLFKESAVQTSITAAVAVIVSVVVVTIDYKLVLLGPILFYLTNTFYQHYMLRKKISTFDNRHFWKHALVLLVGVVSMVGLSLVLPVEWASDSFVYWILSAFVIAALALAVLLTLCMIFDQNSLRLTIHYFKEKNKRKRM